jgi:RNA-directed DNA polymerase
MGIANVRRRENRLKRNQPDSTTEQAQTDRRTLERADTRDGLPPKLSRLRRRLAEKAKREPNFRFYTLYDRIYRLDTLWSAWLLVSRNGGAPGVDGVTIQQIQNDDPRNFVLQLQEELRTKTYKPLPIRRKWIPKGPGSTKQRPLGIPTVRDRVVQMATVLILEPIFETDFLDCSFGFRPGRSAHQALEAIEDSIRSGRKEVYDADLKGYFDSIPRDKLMIGLETRIADRAVLKLIRMWLEAPVIEEDENGRTTARRSAKGTPQGGVISPLLANSFLHWFDRVFHGPTGPATWAKALLVRYADDFVVMAKYVGTRMTHWIESMLQDRFGLEINQDKTSVVNVDEDGTTLNFLGYSFRFDESLYGKGPKYLNRFPSKQSLAKARGVIRELTATRMGGLPIAQVVRRLNSYLIGWSNYFGQGYPREAFRAINVYVQMRMWHHLRRRSQRSLKPPEGMSWFTFLYERLGVIRL